MTSQSADFDVLVIGGGMVGAALATGAAQAGFNTALIEANQPPAFDPEAEVDLRLSAISPGSQALLESLGAWPAIARQRMSPYSQMRVWENSGSGELHFSAADAGLAQLGHIIENRLIVDALWQCLDPVSVFCPARIAGLDLGSDRATITLEDDSTLRARLVVAADGGQSITRQLADIGVYGWAYQQRGIVANIRTQDPHQATAWQRFLPTGPVALLPLADGRCSIVWSAKDALAEELLALSDTEFEARLEQALESRLGEVSLTSQRVGFPLRMQQAEAYCQSRLALVGDAAHVIHPLAGQGVNLGFGDAAELLRVLQKTRDEDRDIGDYRRLRRYERARKAEDALMATVTDGLNRLYASEHPAVKLGRRGGSRLVNLLMPLKSAFIQHAAG